MTLLTSRQVADALAGLAPGWALTDEGRVLVRTFRFGAYLDGIAFVNKVAAVAERLDHHPDLVVTYGGVEVRLTTHDAGGLTGRDLEVAAAIDRIVSG